MEKRALVLVLTLLTCAAAVPASAAGIERGKSTRTTLTLGGFVTSFPQIEIRDPSAPRDSLLQLPSSFTSPVNRFNWSRWLGWIIGDL